MQDDSYDSVAALYDRLFESMLHGLRLAGLRMLRPTKGMRILDVGCGTGTHLDLYRRYAAHLHGLDSAAPMLHVARRRLGDSAHLARGDAASMPYGAGSFDLVLSMLTLHGMPPEVRSAALGEMKRILKRDGRILLIDFHPGPYQPLQGWLSRALIVFLEFAAGREHFGNHRQFISEGGLPAIAARQGLRVEKQSILAGGTFAILVGVPEPGAQ